MPHQVASVTFGGIKREVAYSDHAFGLDPDIQEMFYGPDSGPEGEAGDLTRPSAEGFPDKASSS